MTKEELLSLDNKEYFIATLNIIDKDRIKNIENYNIVEEQINTESKESITIWQDENWNDIIEEKINIITDTIIYISRKYLEWENWMSVQENLFIK